MKKITLYEGIKGSGKSYRIDKEHQRLESLCNEIETINEGDFNTVIYVLEFKATHEIVILNSGSDTIEIIENFEAIMIKYPHANEVYTAIRPDATNPRLHAKMMRALCIAPSDTVMTVQLP